MTLMVELTAEEVHRDSFTVVCMGRYGSSWNTMHRAGGLRSLLSPIGRSSQTVRQSSRLTVAGCSRHCFDELEDVSFVAEAW